MLAGINDGSGYGMFAGEAQRCCVMREDEIIAQFEKLLVQA
jgi:hypothetical protein